ncbi:GAF and ANTAR domain-containing protein [Arsenicicoccus dermatophilus]|uniref:GAF and ANTAR domain-containing protein n=1 Tax=Arsenicicoccus dermatophilus TaxID=1076331 RepID=UPI0039174B5E
MVEPTPEAEVFTTLNALVHETDEPTEIYASIVAAAVHLVDGCDHAAIMLHHHDHYVCAAVSDEVAQQVDDLQIAVDAGPCIDAIEHQDDAIQLDPDLSRDPTWPTLAERVLADTPVRGMIGCRLRIDDRRAGALDFFSDTPGGLTQRSVDQASVLAAMASASIATVVAREEARHLTRALESSREIGKAIGLIMAARKVDDRQAFEVLRTTSQHLNMKLATVAEEIVRGQRAQSRR